jgi:heme/copper-type cytochrome/quinol oxidase subunit 3
VASAVASLETATHGTSHGGDHGHADHPPTSLGVDHRKLGMWVFLASDCMFFGSLIATYLIYRGRAETMYESGQGKGPLPHEILDIPCS